MQAVLPQVSGRPAEVQPVTDEQVRARLLELLSTDRNAPDFLDLYEECDRLISLAMQQHTCPQLG